MGLGLYEDLRHTLLTHKHAVAGIFRISLREYHFSVSYYRSDSFGHIKCVEPDTRPGCVAIPSPAKRVLLFLPLQRVL